jgi:putative flippase GtrA
VDDTTAIAPSTTPSTTSSGRCGLLTQIGRFVAVGCLSAVVDYGLYQLLLHLDVYVHLAKAISFICGTTTAYLLNKRFTFDAPATRGAGRFTGFLVLYGTTFFVNVGVNALALHLIPDGTAARTTICWVLAQGTATTINFLVLRTVVFRR